MTRPMTWNRLSHALIGVLALCLLAPPGRIQASTLPRAAADAISKGKIAAQANDYRLAARYFMQARSAAPGAPVIDYYLGLAESKLPGRELRAICWFGLYLINEPTLPKTLVTAIKHEIRVLSVRSEMSASSVLKLAQAAALKIAHVRRDGISFRSVAIVSIASDWAEDHHEFAAAKLIPTLSKHPGFQSMVWQDIAEDQVAAGDIASLNSAEATLQKAYLAATLVTAPPDSCDALLSIAYRAIDAGAVDITAESLATAKGIATARITNLSMRCGVLWQIAQAYASADNLTAAHKAAAAAAAITQSTGAQPYAAYRSDALAAIAYKMIFWSGGFKQDVQTAKRLKTELGTQTDGGDSELLKIVRLLLPTCTRMTHLQAGPLKIAQLISDPYYRCRTLLLITAREIRLQSANDLKDAGKRFLQLAQTANTIGDEEERIEIYYRLAPQQAHAGLTSDARATRAIVAHMAETSYFAGQRLLQLRAASAPPAKKAAALLQNELQTRLTKAYFLDLPDFLKTLPAAKSPAQLYSPLESAASSIIYERQNIDKALRLAGLN
ncbi:MAG: hypothetical protein HKL96_13565 [Phycisphaerales bacterium]|nr:hypothetical protein [Phycisphaerales bacterium]